MRINYDFCAELADALYKNGLECTVSVRHDPDDRLVQVSPGGEINSKTCIFSETELNHLQIDPVNYIISVMKKAPTEAKRAYINADILSTYSYYKMRKGDVDMKLGVDFRPQIEKVIFNYPATIVFWKDGSKTVTKCGELDIYDPEKGLAMCFAKKLLGNEGNYYNVFTKWLPKEEESDVEYGAPFDEPPIYRQVKEACNKIYDKITNGGY